MGTNFPRPQVEKIDRWRVVSGGSGSRPGEASLVISSSSRSTCDSRKRSQRDGISLFPGIEIAFHRPAIGPPNRPQSPTSAGAIGLIALPRVARVLEVPLNLTVL